MWRRDARVRGRPCVVRRARLGLGRLCKLSCASRVCVVPVRPFDGLGPSVLGCSGAIPIPCAGVQWCNSYAGGDHQLRNKAQGPFPTTYDLDTGGYFLKRSCPVRSKLYTQRGGRAPWVQAPKPRRCCRTWTTCLRSRPLRGSSRPVTAARWRRTHACHRRRRRRRQLAAWRWPQRRAAPPPTRRNVTSLAPRPPAAAPGLRLRLRRG